PKVVRQSNLDLATRTDVALAGDGTAYVASAATSSRPRPSVASLDTTGRVGAWSPVGLTDDSLSEVRTAGARAYVHLLPLDGWIPASESTESSTGMPIDGGTQLL